MNINFSDKDFLELIPQSDMRAVARLITLCENKVPRARKIQAQLYAKTGKAKVVGVTGSPGAGKSTLVDQLAKTWKNMGKKVAILAIDPSSPYSGGAVLGDRIRMVAAAEFNDIFIRSMATRGALGGISRATIDAIQILDAAQFDIILLETVGVGQAEVDVVKTADTCLVVLVPGMGDGVQTIKAGIIEIADLFVINKADRDGADLLQKDLRVLLSLGDYKESDWVPPIVRTVATTGEGNTDLVTQVEKHLDWLNTSGQGEIRRINNLRDKIVKLAMNLVAEKMLDDQRDKLEQVVKDCIARKIDPYSAVESLIGFV